MATRTRTSPTSFSRKRGRPGESLLRTSLARRWILTILCRCDERFIGYGGNKAACLFELYLSGVSFYVLPDDFLIHQSHAYAEKARKHERKYNRKLYTDFREELCFRYLNLFLDQIESPRAKVRAVVTSLLPLKSLRRDCPAGRCVPVVLTLLRPCAQNLAIECKKIKGFSTTAARYIAAAGGVEPPPKRA